MSSVSVKLAFEQQIKGGGAYLRKFSVGPNLMKSKEAIFKYSQHCSYIYTPKIWNWDDLHTYQHKRLQPFKDQISTTSNGLQVETRSLSMCLNQAGLIHHSSCYFSSQRRSSYKDGAFSVLSCVCFSWGGGVCREWCQCHNGFSMWSSSSTHRTLSWSLKANRNCIISTSWLRMPHDF